MGKTRSPDQVLALKRELTVAAMRGVSPMPQRDSCLGLRVRACMAQETLERSQSQERIVFVCQLDLLNQRSQICA